MLFMPLLSRVTIYPFSNWLISPLLPGLLGNPQMTQDMTSQAKQNARTLRHIVLRPSEGTQSSLTLKDLTTHLNVGTSILLNSNFGTNTGSPFFGMWGNMTSL